MKKYMVTYHGHVVRSKASEEDVIKHMENQIGRGCKQEGYEVFEMVPVTLVTKTITTFERTSA